MTDRIPLDHLNSDQYDELCERLDALQQIARGYCPDCGRGDAAPTVEDWEQQKQRAEKAEAALARIQAIADEYPAGIDTALILAELPDRPAGGTPPVHVGGRVNAEDCPACTAAVVPPPYPWICPGEDQPGPTAPNDGPTVAECREADRRWPLQKTGE